MGDINLEANKWKDDGFLLKSIASPLFEGLEECEMIMENLGNTYQADHTLKNGNIPESALALQQKYEENNHYKKIGKQFN